MIILNYVVKARQELIIIFYLNLNHKINFLFHISFTFKNQSNSCNLYKQISSALTFFVALYQTNFSNSLSSLLTFFLFGVIEDYHKLFHMFFHMSFGHDN